MLADEYDEELDEGGGEPLGGEDTQEREIAEPLGQVEAVQGLPPDQLMVLRSDYQREMASLLENDVSSEDDADDEAYTDEAKKKLGTFHILYIIYTS